MILPQDFCNRMKELLGEQYPQFLQSMQKPAQKGVRLFGSATPKQMEQWLNVPFTPWQVDNHAYLFTDSFSGNHPLHLAGALYRQDPSAMVPINSVDWRGDEWVLDMCSAPGGKSSQLAQLLPQGLVVSNEYDTARARTLQGNLERLSCARGLVTNLSPMNVAQTFGPIFDAVVVDAPCSGEGMFRKYPQAVQEWKPENVQMCANRQLEILQYATQCVKQYGLLIYSTCTFSLQENEQVVQSLLDTNCWRLVPTTQRVQQVTVPGVALPLSRRFYPHVSTGEGQFVAVLQRSQPSNAQIGKLSLPILTSKDALLVQKALQDILGFVPNGKLVWVGSNVCLWPHNVGLPSNGVLNAGITLGQIVKGRLVPHHMLFKCFIPNPYHVELNHPHVLAYLHGETVYAPQVPNGFGTFVVEGYPLGGFKAVDGQLKNHYPKGLRI